MRRKSDRRDLSESSAKVLELAVLVDMAGYVYILARFSRKHAPRIVDSLGSSSW
jgi:hypothetical protein